MESRAPIAMSSPIALHWRTEPVEPYFTVAKAFGTSRRLRLQSAPLQRADQRTLARVNRILIALEKPLKDA